MRRKMKFLFGSILVILLLLNNNTIAMTQTDEISQTIESDNTYSEKTQTHMDNIIMELIKQILMRKQTIGSVKQMAYDSLDLKKDPDLEAKVDTFFNILTDLGVTDDMSILEADKIIDENWELIQSSVTGLNRFCNAYIGSAALSNSYVVPSFRLFGGGLRCRWHIDNRIGCSAEISGTAGLQKSKDKDQSGIFLLFLGSSMAVIGGFGDITVRCHLAWISISDVPFV